MAGPTRITVTKGQRAQDGTTTNDNTGGTTTSGMRVIIDSDNVTRQEALFMLESVQEIILKGKWPPF